MTLILHVARATWLSSLSHAAMTGQLALSYIYIYIYIYASVCVCVCDPLSYLSGLTVFALHAYIRKSSTGAKKATRKKCLTFTPPCPPPPTPASSSSYFPYLPAANTRCVHVHTHKYSGRRFTGKTWRFTSLQIESGSFEQKQWVIFSFISAAAAVNTNRYRVVSTSCVLL